MCVVGDDLQSIYAFRGAIAATLSDFVAAYRHPGVQRALSTNYR